jgi:hypothetical protein
LRLRSCCWTASPLPLFANDAAVKPNPNRPRELSAMRMMMTPIMMKIKTFPTETAQNAQGAGHGPFPRAELHIQTRMYSAKGSGPGLEERLHKLSRAGSRPFRDHRQIHPRGGAAGSAAVG